MRVWAVWVTYHDEYGDAHQVLDRLFFDRAKAEAYAVEQFEKYYTVNEEYERPDMITYDWLDGYMMEDNEGYSIEPAYIE